MDAYGGQWTLALLHRGISRRPHPYPPAQAGKGKGGGRRPRGWLRARAAGNRTPAPPNGTVSGRRPSMSRDAAVTSILIGTDQEPFSPLADRISQASAFEKNAEGLNEGEAE